MLTALSIRDIVLVDALAPAAFGKLLNTEIARWMPIVKASGAQAN